MRLHVDTFVRTVAFALTLHSSGLLCAPFAYLPEPGRFGAVNVLDLASNATVRNLGSANLAGAAAVAFSSTGRFVYVIDAAIPSGGVAVFDNSSNSRLPVASISLPSTGFGLVVSPDDRRLYVSLLDNTVAVIDTTTNTLSTTVPVGAGASLTLAVSRASGALYVANQQSNNVSVVDLRTNAVTATIPLGGRPIEVATNADGSLVYVINADSGSVSVITTSTNSVTATIGVAGSPRALVVSPVANRLYVATNSASGDLLNVIDTAANVLLTTVPVGLHASGLAITPDGRTVYINNDSPARLQTFDTVTNAVTGGISGISPAFGASNFIAPDPRSTAVEYYNAALNHYFLTVAPEEIASLDSGVTRGWARTGASFTVYSSANPTNSPVCRYYIPPVYRDSHFYSASPAECAAVHANFPWLPLESPNVFYVGLPNTATGTCSAGEVPVYRVWNTRADSNHRYTTSAAMRDAMVARGYIPEGYGPDQVVMCSPQ